MDQRTAHLFDMASERFLVAVQMLTDLEGMKAENEMRRMQGEAPAYGEEAFAQLRHAYDGRLHRF